MTDSDAEGRYRAFFEHAPESLFVVRVEADVSFVHEEANPACERLLGRSDAAMRGRAIADILPPPIVGSTLARFRHCIAARQPVQYEVEFDRPMGRVVREVVLVPLFGDDGAVVRILGSSRDVTERKSAEAALRHSEEEFRRLFVLAPVPLHSVDPDGRLIAVSDAWLALLGYARGDVLGGSPADFMIPESAHFYRDVAWPEFVESTDIRSYEYEMVKKSGERAQVVLAARALRDASGRLQRSLSVIIDVTERRRAEEQLRRAHKLEALGRMTGTVAHDFNNLLTVIGGNLELLHEHAGDARRLRLVEAAQRGVERGQKLTQQLLSFSRRQPLRPRLVPLNQLVADMVPLLRQAVGAAVQISLELDPIVPPCRIDPTQFEAAVLNLAVNARDAMPNGGALVLSTRALAEGVELAVRDTGEGMPPDVLERVFEPFFTTKQGGKGSGLGLAQVYGFAQQSGGEVRVESAPQKGTTVRLLLPVPTDGAEGRS